MPDSAANQTPQLRTALDRVGYYPAEVAAAVEDSLAGETVVSYVIHHEPTFDREEVRRHITVLVLTPSRLLITHTDENPPDDLLPRPYTSTSTEAIPLARIGSVSLTRMVALPIDDLPGANPPVAEAVLTVGWGAVSRVDLEPAECGDPECVADHGYTGAVTAEDFSLRISATADGDDAVGHLLGFTRSLSAASIGP
ncbi:MAG: hypothetical protein QOI51_1158 [Nocardioidaceae bacterium]|nr:hypothetical protein [Nocardioidaceae bacterium]